MADIFDLLPPPSGKVLRWLLDEGVSCGALYSVKGAWVSFDSSGTFDFAAAGEPARIFRCMDRGETVDLAAWSRGRLGTWRGAGFCIGDLDQCFNPATWLDGGGLRVHVGPLDWLRADGDGIVILKPELCWAHLRNVPRVICANDISAALVHKHTRAPRCTTKIFIQSISKKGIAA